MLAIDSMERFLDAQTKISCHRDVEHVCIPGAVIAISREPGCNGEAIAQSIADEFKMALYDWNIVEQVAKDSNVSERVVDLLDASIRSNLDSWLTGFTESGDLSRYQHLQSLRKVLFTIASHGNAVILGRGANFMIPPEKKTLGICLVAPQETKVKSIMQELGLSTEDAMKHLVTAEREQQLWLKNICDVDIKDATHYHLVINTALVDSKKIIEILREMLGADYHGSC